MKKLIISLVIILLTVTVAMASWVADFELESEELGIIIAVGNALKAPETDEDGNEILPGPGIPQGRVAAIIENGLQLEVVAANLIMALYCNQVDSQQIIDAVYHQYPEEEEKAQDLLDAGYKKAEAECLEVIRDSQAYPRGPGAVASGRLNGGGGSYATPDTP